MRSIERVSVIDQVVEQLQSAVIDGTFAVGDKLPTEQEFCERLNVGRSTVREALRVLQAIGLIELRPGRGAFVADSRVQDERAIALWFAQNRPTLSDVMELREAIEPLSVKLAALRRKARELSRIREIHEQFVIAAGEQNVPKLALLDEEFHTAIAESTGNSLIVRMNRLIANELREYRVRALATPDRIAHALHPHGEILKAIERQDAASAVSSMIEHLELSIDDIMREADLGDAEKSESSR